MCCQILCVVLVSFFLFLIKYLWYVKNVNNSLLERYLFLFLFLLLDLYSIGSKQLRETFTISAKIIPAGEDFVLPLLSFLSNDILSWSLELLLL